MSYLITRGDTMTRREIDAVQAQESALKQYIQSAGGSSASAAEELERLASLRDRGILDDAEFGRMKAKIVG